MAHRRSDAKARPGWKLAAMAAGLGVAGAPMPAVPLAARDVAPPAVDRHAGPAAALVVDAVLRVARDVPAAATGVVTS